LSKLTKKFVERLEPHPDRDCFVWDAALPGFGLRLYPSGVRKYVVQYRTQDNRQRRSALAQHGVLTVEQARELARDILAKVRKGADPAAEKKATRDAPTVRDLARDYIDRHAIPNKRPSSVADDEAMLKRVILPKLSPVKVAAVGRQDIEKLHNSLRSTPYMANRLLALLSKMFNLAIAWGWRASNPAKGIPRFHEDRRQKWLSDQELAILWALLERHPNRRSARAVMLLTLTGARRNEVLGATWDQFDLNRAVWTKPSHHTKTKRTEHVPLSNAALALLSAMLSEADPQNPYLFPGDAPDKPLSDIKKFWRSLCRSAGLEKLRLHDLRHSYASNLVSQGVSLHIVGKLLGHTQPQTTARYAHLDDAALRQATEGFSKSVGLPEARPAVTLHRKAKSRHK
jgi:integrase